MFVLNVIVSIHRYDKKFIWTLFTVENKNKHEHNLV